MRGYDRYDFKTIFSSTLACDSFHMEIVHVECPGAVLCEDGILFGWKWVKILYKYTCAFSKLCGTSRPPDRRASRSCHLSSFGFRRIAMYDNGGTLGTNSATRRYQLSHKTDSQPVEACWSMDELLIHDPLWSEFSRSSNTLAGRLNLPMRRRQIHAFTFCLDLHQIFRMPQPPKSSYLVQSPGLHPDKNGSTKSWSMPIKYVSFLGKRRCSWQGRKEARPG